MVRHTKTEEALETIVTNMDDDKSNKNKTLEKKPQWKETCLGIWTRGTREQGDNTDCDRYDWICNGISVVKIDKNVDKESVKLSKTRGVQIIIQETDGDHRLQDMQENDTEDKERDPQRHVFPPEDPSLGGRLVDVVKKKKEKVEKNVEQFVTGGTSPSDVWVAFSGLIISWYQTSYRIVSYCKPKEKAYQMYNFASTRVKDIGSHWRKKK